jgi:hypothetical protein
MHLTSPQHETEPNSMGQRLKRLLQHPTTENGHFFSCFYTIVTTSPLVVMFVFWLVVLPHEYKDGQSIHSRGSRHCC